MPFDRSVLTCYHIHFLRQAKLAMERIIVEKEFHPFICGPNNRDVTNLMSENGVKINVPPLSVNKDEITVSGEKEGVLRAAQRIRQIYEEKVSRSLDNQGFPAKCKMNPFK